MFGLENRTCILACILREIFETKSVFEHWRYLKTQMILGDKRVVHNIASNGEHMPVDEATCNKVNSLKNSNVQHWWSYSNIYVGHK